MLRQLTLLLVAGLAASAGHRANADAPKPHIIMLLTDNMGWANVGFHRPPGVPAREIHTPNIDQLAKTGMILDRHYTCASPSPSATRFPRRNIPLSITERSHVATYRQVLQPIPQVSPPTQRTVFYQLSVTKWRFS